MTDLQIRAQANAIKQDELALETKKLAEQQRANLAKEAELERSHKVTETLKDLENQVKYGYDSYMPITEAGDYRRTSAWGAGQIPFDWFKNKIGAIASPIGNIVKGGR